MAVAKRVSSRRTAQDDAAPVGASTVADPGPVGLHRPVVMFGLIKSRAPLRKTETTTEFVYPDQQRHGSPYP